MTSDDTLIFLMHKHALIVMPSKIGYEKTGKFLKNYKFPEDHVELEKLYNLWSGVLANTINEIEKPTKQELDMEFRFRQIPAKLYIETFKKYYKKIGPSKIYEWFAKSRFLYDYKLERIESEWDNVTKELDELEISKRTLYKDLMQYYKDSSKLKYLKYWFLSKIF